jgi:hypothetical protein
VEGFTVVSPPMARKGMTTVGLKMMVGVSCKRVCLHDEPERL